jgi:hypothetical protein
MTSCIIGGLSVFTSHGGMAFITAGKKGKYLPSIEASEAPTVASSQSGENPGFFM